MFIIVRESDKMIVSTAVNKVNETRLKEKGYIVYEIDKTDIPLVGQILNKFEKIEKNN